MGLTRYSRSLAPKGISVRIKLAWFAAAAVIFAPGWGSAGPDDRHFGAAGLTGRILAPTLDEARVTSGAETGVGFKHVDRVKLRHISPKTFVWLSAGFKPSFVGALCAMVVAPAPVGFARGIRGARSSRAPPHLVTA